MLRIAINGYGRIGRVAHRIILEKHAGVAEVVAINAGNSTDIEGWLMLFKYDSVYGTIKGHKLASTQVEEKKEGEQIGTFTVDDKEIALYAERDPEKLPWKVLGIDVVIESTGAFTKYEDLKKHENAGAKAVVLSAPAKGDTPVPTYVLGVNLVENQKNVENIISNASCTTNCIAPPTQIILDNFGIKKAIMTTIHGYTSDQRLHDGGHEDYRRARAAALNVVPTSTGAAEAATLAIPKLKDKFTGLAVRVPVPVGSLSDITYVVEKPTTKEEVNEAFKNAAKEDRYKEILAVTQDPIVSSDIVGEPYSAIVDLSLTKVVDGDLVKVIAWYDNEYGYANRLVEESILVGNALSTAGSPVL